MYRAMSTWYPDNYVNMNLLFSSIEGLSTYIIYIYYTTRNEFPSHRRKKISNHHIEKITSWRCLTCWPIKLWRRKMTSLVNKSADWTPNYHEILIFFPKKSLKSLRAARIDELASNYLVHFREELLKPRSHRARALTLVELMLFHLIWFLMHNC